MALKSLRGGLARAKALSPERRKEIARLAVQARWKKAKLEKSKKSRSPTS